MKHRTQELLNAAARSKEESANSLRRSFVQAEEAEKAARRVVSELDRMNGHQQFAIVGRKVKYGTE